MLVIGYFVFLSECPSFLQSALGFFSLTGIVFDRFYSDFAYTCISDVDGFELLVGEFLSVF